MRIEDVQLPCGKGVNNEYRDDFEEMAYLQLHIFGHLDNTEMCLHFCEEDFHVCGKNKQGKGY